MNADKIKNSLVRIACERYAKDLPEQLESKAVIISETGTIGKVIRCSACNSFGERLYRLRYTYKFTSGAVHEITSDQPYIEKDRRGNPVVIGHGWTRDQLASMGCRYICRRDVEPSKVLDAIPLFGN
jgi:hypothetical protein